MPNYLLYRDDVETIETDEEETHAKIVKVMTEGMQKVREKEGRAVRISHAKAHGLLKGQMVLRDDLPPELAQGMFARAATYDVLVRLATAPGEFTDDSKISTVRGMAVKVLGVTGEKLTGHTAATQDWVLDTGKEFITSGSKAFLQAFTPNAEIAPKLPDAVKGAVSMVARATNAALNAVGANSEKMDFYGHQVKHPMDEAYYTQTPYRYGAYVAKLGVIPDSAGLKAVQGAKFDPETPDALRDATNEYFKAHGAEFSVRVQLNTGLKEMPIEDAMAKWSEDDSQYQEVARLVIPAQTAWDPVKDGYFEDLSFSPGHSLATHRPLGGINRARLVAYRAMSAKRLAENGKTENVPVGMGGGSGPAATVFSPELAGLYADGLL